VFAVGECFNAGFPEHVGWQRQLALVQPVRTSRAGH
jgi:hypothetical protein